MKKVTVWEPDTCGCVIEIHFDTDDPPDDRPARYEQRRACRVHSGADGAERALEDNRRKNEVLAAAGEDAGWNHVETPDGYVLVVELDKGRLEAAQDVAARHGRKVILAPR